MTLSITYGIVTLTVDYITSFLQISDVQNKRKNKCFSLNKSCGKFLQSVQDGVIVIDYKGFIYVFILLVC